MRDGDLRNLFRKHLGHRMHFQPIEIGATARGVPDSNLCAEGIEVWVEFKGVNTRYLDLRPEQKGWFIERLRYGGRVLLAVRLTIDRDYDSLLLFNGAIVQDFNRVIENNMHHLIFSDQGGPRKWNWDKLYHKLLRG